uniref:Protein kinase domain-containing protein n=1 Tax=Nelumbo nucifera TaxID=4432 RepID=A0A822ZZS0_NELNU|nr:TPA_asm: hypothetical protein HUJ06_018968 [Nelumbo nucifera]
MTILLVITQCQINRVEFVHAKSFLHRDIKPDNFLMGLGRRANQVLVLNITSCFIINNIQKIFLMCYLLFHLHIGLHH